MENKKEFFLALQNLKFCLDKLEKELNIKGFIHPVTKSKQLHAYIYLCNAWNFMEKVWKIYSDIIDEEYQKWKEK